MVEPHIGRCLEQQMTVYWAARVFPLAEARTELRYRYRRRLARYGWHYLEGQLVIGASLLLRLEYFPSWL